jgi:hypothetical protein
MAGVTTLELTPASAFRFVLSEMWLSAPSARFWRYRRKRKKVDMHETALVRDVVGRIEDLAHATGARRIAGAKI